MQTMTALGRTEGTPLMHRRGPLAGRYWPTAAMVVFALVPFLGLASALGPIEPIIGTHLHMSAHALSVSMGMANAAYAVGTVLAVALGQRFGQRRLLVVYAAMLVTGSVLAAAAADPAMFVAGHVLQGLSTSLLLIAAVPPLVTGFHQVAQFRWTAVIMNLGIFGAVAAGPLVGDAEASFGTWRPPGASLPSSAPPSSPPVPSGRRQPSGLFSAAWC